MGCKINRLSKELMSQIGKQDKKDKVRLTIDVVRALAGVMESLKETVINDDGEIDAPLDKFKEFYETLTDESKVKSVDGVTYIKYKNKLWQVSKSKKLYNLFSPVDKGSLEWRVVNALSKKEDVIDIGSYKVDAKELIAWDVRTGEMIDLSAPTSRGKNGRTVAILAEDKWRSLHGGKVHEGLYALVRDMEDESVEDDYAKQARQQGLSKESVLANELEDLSFTYDVETLNDMKMFAVRAFTQAIDGIVEDLSESSDPAARAASMDRHAAVAYVGMEMLRDRVRDVLDRSISWIEDEADEVDRDNRLAATRGFRNVFDESMSVFTMEFREYLIDDQEFDEEDVDTMFREKLGIEGEVTQEKLDEAKKFWLTQWRNQREDIKRHLEALLYDGSEFVMKAEGMDLKFDWNGDEARKGNANKEDETNRDDDGRTNREGYQINEREDSALDSVSARTYRLLMDCREKDMLYNDGRYKLDTMGEEKRVLATQAMGRLVQIIEGCNTGKEAYEALSRNADDPYVADAIEKLKSSYEAAKKVKYDSSGKAIYDDNGVLFNQFFHDMVKERSTLAQVYVQDLGWDETERGRRKRVLNVKVHRAKEGTSGIIEEWIVNRQNGVMIGDWADVEEEQAQLWLNNAYGLLKNKDKVISHRDDLWLACKAHLGRFGLDCSPADGYWASLSDDDFYKEIKKAFKVAVPGSEASLKSEEDMVSLQKSLETLHVSRPDVRERSVSVGNKHLQTRTKPSYLGKLEKILSGDPRRCIDYLMENFTSDIMWDPEGETMLWYTWRGSNNGQLTESVGTAMQQHAPDNVCMLKGESVSEDGTRINAKTRSKYEDSQMSATDIYKGAEKGRFRNSYVQDIYEEALRAIRDGDAKMKYGMDTIDVVQGLEGDDYKDWSEGDYERVRMAVATYHEYMKNDMQRADFAYGTCGYYQRMTLPSDSPHNKYVRMRRLRSVTAVAIKMADVLKQEMTRRKMVRDRESIDPSFKIKYFDDPRRSDRWMYIPSLNTMLIDFSSLSKELSKKMTLDDAIKAVEEMHIYTGEGPDLDLVLALAAETAIMDEFEKYGSTMMDEYGLDISKMEGCNNGRYARTGEGSLGCFSTGEDPKKLKRDWYAIFGVLEGKKEISSPGDDWGNKEFGLSGLEEKLDKVDRKVSSSIKRVHKLMVKAKELIMEKKPYWNDKETGGRLMSLLTQIEYELQRDDIWASEAVRSSDYGMTVAKWRSVAELWVDAAIDRNVWSNAYGRGHYGEDALTLFANSMYNTAQLIQLTQDDIAFNKDMTDFQKRNKQTVAPGQQFNTDSTYGRKYERVVVFRDISGEKATTAYKDGIEAALRQKVERGEINEKIANILIDKYVKGDFVMTDGQALRTMESMRATLDMAGKWDKSMTEAFDRLMDGTWTIDDLTKVVLIQKYYSYDTQLETDERGNRIRRGVQFKDGNAPMMALLQSLPGVTRRNDLMAGIQQWMENNCIDVAEFDSSQKIGNRQEVLSISLEEANEWYAEIKRLADTKPNKANESANKARDIVKFVNEKTETEKDKKSGRTRRGYGATSAQARIVQAYLENKTGLENRAKLSDKKRKEIGNDKDADVAKNKYIISHDYENRSVQTPQHEHLSDIEVSMGVQLMKLIVEDMTDGTVFTMRNSDGTETALDKNAIKALYQRLLSSKTIDGFMQLRNVMVNPKKLGNALRSAIKSNKRYGNQMTKSFDVDENGEFRVPLFELMNMQSIQSLINSMARKRTMKTKLRGGKCIQMTCFGVEDELGIVMNCKDSNGKITELSLDSEIERLMNQGMKRTEAKARAIELMKDAYQRGELSVAYYECYMPCWSKELLEAYIKPSKDGELIVDMNAIPEELREMIGYRVPTEDKYSMFPLKIKGFLPQNSGSVCIMPSEITLITGSDFDIDSVYIIMRDFDIDYSKAKVNIDRLASDLLKSLEKKNDDEARIMRLLSSQGLLKDTLKQAMKYMNVGVRKKKRIGDKLKDILSPVAKKGNVGVDELMNFVIDVLEKFLTKKGLGETKAGRNVYMNPLVTRRYDYSRDVAGQGRKERNNAIVDIAWSVLTNPDTVGRMLNPGGFDVMKKCQLLLNLLRAGANIDFASFRQMTLEEAQEFAKTEVSDDVKSRLPDAMSPLNPLTYVYYFGQNKVGGIMTAIAASNASAHALLQDLDVRYKNGSTSLKLNGKELNRIDGIRLSDDPNSEELEYISKLLGTWVAAAVDNAKEPTSKSLNFTERTSKVVALMLRSGWSLEETSVFVTQPAVMKLFKLMLGGKIKEGTAIRNVVSAYKEEIDRDQLSEEDKELLKDIEDGKEFNIPFERLMGQYYGKDDPLTQLMVITSYRRLNNVGNDLMTASTVHRTDKAIGQDVFDIMAYEDKIDKMKKARYRLEVATPRDMSQEADEKIVDELMLGSHEYVVLGVNADGERAMRVVEKESEDAKVEIAEEALNEELAKEDASEENDESENAAVKMTEEDEADVESVNERYTSIAMQAKMEALQADGRIEIYEDGEMSFEEEGKGTFNVVGVYDLDMRSERSNALLYILAPSDNLDRNGKPLALPSVRSQYYLGVKALEMMYSRYMPFFSEEYNAVLNRISEITSVKIEDADMKRMIMREYTLFKMLRETKLTGDFRNLSEAREYFFNGEFREYFFSLKERPWFKDNEFLKRLWWTGQKQKERYHISTLVMSDQGGYSKEKKIDIETAWLKLYRSRDLEQKDLAIKLFQYCILRNGGQYSDGYNNFVPQALKAELEGYVSSLRRIQEETQRPVDMRLVDRFVQQFILNHSYDVQGIGRRVENDGSFLGETVVIDMSDIFTSANLPWGGMAVSGVVKPNEKKGTAGEVRFFPVIRTNNPFSGTSKNIFYMLQKIDGFKATYVQTPVLGFDGNAYLEYDPLAEIPQSVINNKKLNETNGIQLKPEERKMIKDMLKNDNTLFEGSDDLSNLQAAKNELEKKIKQEAKNRKISGGRIRIVTDVFKAILKSMEDVRKRRQEIEDSNEDAQEREEMDSRAAVTQNFIDALDDQRKINKAKKMAEKDGHKPDVPDDIERPEIDRMIDAMVEKVDDDIKEGLAEMRNNRNEASSQGDSEDIQEIRRLNAEQKEAQEVIRLMREVRQSQKEAQKAAADMREIRKQQEELRRQRDEVNRPDKMDIEGMDDNEDGEDEGKSLAKKFKKGNKLNVDELPDGKTDTDKCI